MVIEKQSEFQAPRFQETDLNPTSADAAKQGLNKLFVITKS